MSIGASSVESSAPSASCASVFADGGGEMGARIRAFDWGSTPLGPIDDWPFALRIAVDQMLGSRFPACLFWGPQLTTIYNDGYRPMLGAKPEALGQSPQVTWAEVWDNLKPLADKALAGESTFVEDHRLSVDRAGGLQDAWFTFCYSPVFDEQGHIAGMLNTVVETTGKVLAMRRAAEERDRQLRLQEQIPGFVAVLEGPELRFTYVNAAFSEIVGNRDVIGRPLRDAFPDLAGQGYFEIVEGVYRTGERATLQSSPARLRASESDLFIDVVYEPMRDADGRIMGVFQAGYDVTARRNALAAAEASEARLRALNADLERQVVERALTRGITWQVTPDLLSVVRGDGRFETVNPAWRATLGWDEQAMIGKPFMDFVHPDDVDKTVAAWEDVSVRALPVLRFENRYRAAGGGWRWLSWVSVPEDGKVYCSARDVTPEKERALELAARTAERDVLARIVETTSVFIQVIDPSFRILAVNRANADEYQRVYGRRPVVGDSLLELLSDKPNLRDTACAVWSRALAGESFTVQDEFGGPAVERRQYEMRFEPLYDGGGALIGAFMLSTDITDRLREQVALQEAQDALRQAQKMEAVGQLTGGLAHDFNNLLASISGALQVVKVKLQRGTPEGLERYIDMGENAVRRAAALTQRLLAFSRRQTLDPKPTDVNRLVAGMEDLIRRTVGPQVDLEVVGAGGLWTTRVDPSQLENALLNLCINARDAMMPTGGRLTIETANKWLDDRAAAAREVPPGHYVSLCVTDTGSGMTPAIAKRVFDPFFTTKPIGQGTGLGLSMVYGFVRQSGGQVRVYSEVGHGTTFCLYLPRHLGEAAADTSPYAAQPLAPGDGETLLLIEDEAGIRELLAEVLVEAGYRVLTAEDGPAGLRILETTGRIDLLVTDVGLPGGLNGRQVADAGRLLIPTMKVLFVTGYAENAAVGNGLMESGMQVMTKPFEIAALASKVREMLDGA